MPPIYPAGNRIDCTYIIVDDVLAQKSQKRKGWQNQCTIRTTITRIMVRISSLGTIFQEHKSRVTYTKKEHSHTHIHTHVHTLTHTYTLSHSHTHSHTHTRTFSLQKKLRCSQTVSLSKSTLCWGQTPKLLRI